MTELTLQDPALLGITAAACVLAGFVRGFAGFGGPAVLVLVLTQFFAPASVVLKVMLIDVVANSYLVPSSFRSVRWRTALPLSIATLVTMPLGMLALEVLDPVLIKRAIAVVVGLCSLVLLLGWRYRRRPGIAVLILIGAFSGVVLGATYLILIVVVFLLAGPDDAATSRANIIVWAFCMALAFIGTHVAIGNVVWHEALPALALGVLYALMSAAGGYMFARSREERYRRFVLWLLAMLAGIGVVT